MERNLVDFSISKIIRKTIEIAEENFKGDIEKMLKMRKECLTELGSDY